MNKMVCMILIFLVTNQLIAMEVVAESAESSASVIQLLTDKQVNRAFGSLSDERLQEDLLAIDPVRSPVVHDGLMRHAIARFTSKKYLKNFEGKASIALLEEHSAQCPKIAADVAKIVEERLQLFKTNHGFLHQESDQGRFPYPARFSHFSHDGQLLAYLRGNAKAIDVWHVGEGWKQNTIIEREPYDFYFSPENKFLLVKKDEKTVDIFRLANDTKVNTICGKNGAAVSPDGKYVATFDDENVQILDVVSGQTHIIEHCNHMRITEEIARQRYENCYVTVTSERGPVRVRGDVLVRDGYDRKSRETFGVVYAGRFSSDGAFLFIFVHEKSWDYSHIINKFDVATGQETSTDDISWRRETELAEPRKYSLAQNLMLLKAIQHAQLKWWQCYA